MYFRSYWPLGHFFIKTFFRKEKIYKKVFDQKSGFLSTNLKTSENNRPYYRERENSTMVMHRIKKTETLVRIQQFLLSFLLFKEGAAMANTKEKDFQSSFLKEVREKFPGCFILKNDSGYMQGVPDWLILYKDKWAMIEMKKSADATHRPNQDWYVNQLNQMGYCTFAYPENREEVMNDLERTFEAEG